MAESSGFLSALISEVSGVVRAPVREMVMGSALTTFAIGGPVRALVSVDTPEELANVLRLLSSSGQPWRVLGNGSNVLFADAGFDGWLIKLGAGFKRVSPLGSGRFEVFAATPLMSYSRKVSDEGFSGLEFAAGIPASVGGAVYMNAGAHGAEISSLIVEVRGLTGEGGEIRWLRHELPWSYRHSGLPNGCVITSVVLDLPPGEPKRISEQCAHNLAERRARQPLALPSAGSVFKNPSSGLPAGKMLEEIGMKGFAVGGAEVSRLHANWIVNPDRGATAADVVSVIDECQRRALQERGVALEPEVRLWV